MTFFPIFFIAIGIVNLLLFRVNAKGYVIDAENGMLEFPGGGIKVQNWTSHFNPLYLFQEFMRHKIALAEIREIHPPLNMRRPFACERTKQDRTQRRFWRRFAFIPIKGKTG